MNKDKIEVFYFKNYKKLMFLPVIVLCITLIYLGTFYAQTGDLFIKDVSLKGGISATVYTEQEIDIDQLAAHLQVESSIRRLTDFSSGKQLGVIVDVSDMTAEQLESSLEQFVGFELNQDNYSVEETGAKLGAAFTKQLLIAILFAFILMAVSVSISFRTFVPSIAVILAVLMDIAIPLAIFNMLGKTLSTAGIIAFLLIIGYSVDTDILLTTWAIKKREKSLFERMFHSMKTGLTMVVAAAVVMIVGIVFSNSEVIKEMFTVILLALATDIFATYFTNAGILVWYCQKKGIK